MRNKTARPTYANPGECQQALLHHDIFSPRRPVDLGHASSVKAKKLNNSGHSSPQLCSLIHCTAYIYFQISPLYSQEHHSDYSIVQSIHGCCDEIITTCIVLIHPLQCNESEHPRQGNELKPTFQTHKPGHPAKSVQVLLFEILLTLKERLL